MAAQEGKRAFSGIVSATRMHLPHDATEIPEATAKHLRNYVVSVRRLGISAAIAVNAFEDEVKRIAAEVDPDFKVAVLPVPCWGAFVPALNTLLNFSQRCGMKYILYQSLEVQCTAAILERFLDHHTRDTLVVGPVFDGHTFNSGERPLNGRTTPWNTLALWSVRKLALTGFLCIADGLPDVPPSVGKDSTLSRSLAENPQDPGPETAGPMGSDDWWTRELSSPGGGTGSANAGVVPAGVEEVTAIALLQHLHGNDRARAVLLQLPRELEEQLRWEASWGQDERRAKWHKHKMESKVSRPAAQMEELFKFRTNLSGSTGTCLRRRTSGDELEKQGKSENPQEAAAQATVPVQQEALVPSPATPYFATVMHYGESIAPPPQVLWLCLASCGLFSANSTAVLASAFRTMNTDTSPWALAFAGLLMGAVYLPMPLSLWLTRTVTHRANHLSGLVFFGGTLLLGHICSVLGQLLGWGASASLAARLVQGLGCGIGFQARYVLASLSTSDQHAKLQSLIFLASDLGLGLGALLPVALRPLSGAIAVSPDLLGSTLLACITLLYLVWVALSFPKNLHFLSDRVRFPSRNAKPAAGKEGSSSRGNVFISGTLRVFVQSAIMPVVALSMRDAQWTGNFRQTFAMAAICWLPMPFEALASRICCVCSVRTRHGNNVGLGLDSSKLISGVVGAVALAAVCASPAGNSGEDGERVALLKRLCELAILMIALAMAAPFNASRLYQLKDAECAVVRLEWMKAYIGRLLGPIFAVLLYSWVGYPMLLALLCLATGVVSLTA